MNRLNDIDWQNWQPREHATLLFIIRNNKILLIHKKRGLGAGKINGPGGRIEPGETPEKCAIREIEEELCITAINPRQCGEMSFQFTDGYSLHCTVFTATEYSGTPCETDEAVPLWFPLDQIPYEKMWQDDRYWVPLMIAGKKFKGFFLFNDDTMLDKKITELT